DDASGKRIKCPKCRAACLVPQVASAPLPVHKSSQRSEAPPEAEIRQCPFCSEKILATARKCKHCGEIIDPELKESRRRASGAQRPVVSALAVVRADPADREVARAIDRLAARKSLGLSIALTLLFGPLGLLYSTVDGGLIMLGVSFLVGVLSIFTCGLASVLFFVTYRACIVWGALAVNSYNQQLMRRR